MAACVTKYQLVDRPHNDIQEVSSVVAECVIFLPNSLLAFRSNYSGWSGEDGEENKELKRAVLLSIPESDFANGAAVVQGEDDL